MYLKNCINIFVVFSRNRRFRLKSKIALKNSFIKKSPFKTLINTCKHTDNTYTNRYNHSYCGNKTNNSDCFFAKHFLHLYSVLSSNLLIIDAACARVAVCCGLNVSSSIPNIKPFVYAYLTPSNAHFDIWLTSSNCKSTGVSIL